MSLTALPVTTANNNQPRFFALTIDNLRDPNYDMRPCMHWLMEHGSPALKAHVATLLAVSSQNTLLHAAKQEPNS